MVKSRGSVAVAQAALSSGHSTRWGAFTARGAGSRTAALAMVFRLVESAQAR